MNKLALFMLFSVYLFSCSAPSNTKNPEYTFPPEWAPHQAVWVGWSDNQRHTDANELLLEVVDILSNHVKVKMVVLNDSIENLLSFRLDTMGVALDSIEFIRHFDTFLWMRDPGPFFVKSQDGAVAIADFKWNAYNWFKVYRGINNPDSLPQVVRNLDRYGQYFADYLGIELVNQAKTYAEGGAMEVNGQGTLMAVMETALDRNPNKSLEEIEADYLRTFGKTNMLWLKRSIVSDLSTKGPVIGNYIGGGANGHIDEFCRFVNDSTILLGEISEEEAAENVLSKADRDALEENYNYIKEQRQPNGKPWNIVRMPMPNLDLLAKTQLLNPDRDGYDDIVAKGFKVGDTLKNYPASSYLNFLITNNLVLGAKYWKPGLPESIRKTDEEAKAILETLFPERKVVLIDAMRFNWNGGGIHCVTQQQPR